MLSWQAVGLTEGYFREIFYIKQKISQKNPSTSFAGSPPLSGEAIFIQAFPFQK